LKPISLRYNVSTKTLLRGVVSRFETAAPLLLFAKVCRKLSTLNPEPIQHTETGKMSRQELAKALRVRLAEKFTRENQDGRVPDARDSFLQNLKSTSDDNVIAGYLTCSVCGQVSIPLHSAVRIAEDCGTAEEWVGRVVAWERFLCGCCHDISKPN
jgi:hypothetical protein